MINNINNCLEQNKSILGENCENLGKYKDSHKVLLSYNNKRGFEVVRLNFLQMILRNVFGFYSSTHLNTIAKKLWKIKDETNSQENLLNSCQIRINDLWTKKNVIALGNSNITDAEVVCFGEKHGRRLFRETITQQINATYQEGDIILVEAYEAGIEVGNKTQWTKHLKPGCIVRGWEPKIGPFNPFTERAEKMQKQMYSQLEDINSLAEKKQLNEEDKLEIKEMIERFKVEVRSLAELFKTPEKKISHVDRFLDVIFEENKDDEDFGALISYALGKVLNIFEKDFEKALYRDKTPERLKAIIEGAKTRNISLVNEIEIAFATGKKVYVIAGSAHLIKISNVEDGCELVKEALNKHKFTILTTKDSFDLFRSALNPDLKRL